MVGECLGVGTRNAAVSVWSRHVDDAGGGGAASVANRVKVRHCLLVPLAQPDAAPDWCLRAWGPGGWK